MMKTNYILSTLLLAAAAMLPARAAGEPAAEDSIPQRSERKGFDAIKDINVSGTIRGKWECQTEEGESRFEVRTARIAIDGHVVPMVEYKAEIDLCDEGNIKMLDAYAGVLPTRGMAVRIGQMRVPFSIDAHRSPHKQYFANRSFLAKQVGDVRDVGAYVGYQLPGTGLTLEGGIFNGSGLTKQKNYWTKKLNFSAKAQLHLDFGLTLEASVQKISPNATNVLLYDGGATLQRGRWTLEAEYIRKHYTHGVFADVNAWDAFVCYDQPLRRAFRKVSILARYDMMDDHSDGTLADDGLSFKLTDGKRHRLTGGITLSLGKKMNADIRLNYEKYFYDDASLAKTSERDKAVVEFVVHFPNK